MYIMEITVAVESNQDISLKTALIPDDALSKIDGFSSGDCVKITFKSKTAVVELISKKFDENAIQLDTYSSDKLDIDGRTRAEVSTVDSADCESLIITPVEENISGSNKRAIKNGIKSSLSGKFVSKSEKISTELNGKKTEFEISNFEPDTKAVKIRKNTSIIVSYESDVGNITSPEIELESELETDMKLSDIKGCDEAVDSLRRNVINPIQNQNGGISMLSNILLYGPSGVGKTTLAKAVAGSAEASLFFVPSDYMLSPDKYLISAIEESKTRDKSVVVLDDLDRVAPTKNKNRNQMEASGQIKRAFDSIDNSENIVIIGTARSREEIDDTFYSPNRFAELVEIGIPDMRGRFEILRQVTYNMGLNIDDDFLLDVSEQTVGYTGSDLRDLCRKATLNIYDRTDLEDSADKDLQTLLGNGIIKYSESDFQNAISQTNPTLLEKYDVSIPDVTWEDIGGYDSVIRDVRATIEGPLEAPHLWDDNERATGIILFGPPGTGKTTIARAMANESNRTFIGVNATSFKDRYVGETERNIRELFSLADRVSPSIIYIDEIEAIAQQRGTVNGSPTADAATSELLSQLDGLEDRGDVIIVGSTNADYDPTEPLQYQEDVNAGLDRAMLRPGRLGTHFHIGLPNEKEREQIFRIHMERVASDDNVIIDNFKPEEMANMVENIVGADIESICWNAKELARQELLENYGSYDNIPKSEEIVIEREHFEESAKAY